VWSVRVVMVDEDAEHVLEVAAVHDQEPVEAVGCVNSSAVRICPFCSDIVLRYPPRFSLAQTPVKEARPGCAIVRVDRFQSDDEHRFTVKRIVWTQEKLVEMVGPRDHRDVGVAGDFAGTA
jgi:hypothetical protein